MNTQLWLVTEWFLYFELVVIILLTLPILKSYRFKILNRFFKKLCSKPWLCNCIFYPSIACLSFMFIQSMIRMFQVRSETGTTDERIIDSKLFQTQRHLYISGLALLLAFPIRCLVFIFSKYELSQERNPNTSSKLRDTKQQDMKEQLPSKGNDETLVQQASDISELNRRNAELTNELKEAKEIRAQLDEVKKSNENFTIDLKEARKSNHQLSIERNGLKSKYDELAKYYSDLLRKHQNLTKK